jgi:uncharacterized membrane-anchored protein YhcB (DUF1043 family)
MKKNKLIFMIMLLLFTISLALSSVSAVEVAPRISDREIVERLTTLEEGQKRLGDRIDAVDKRIDDFRSEMNSRFGAVDKRFDSMDKRLDLLTWMFGLFITIALVMLGAVVRMQWQMQKRQTSLETSLETQKDEIAFLKGLIEKFFPPKGAL